MARRGQLVFNADQFELARSGFAEYARDDETAKELRARVNRTILEDLEQKILALRELHAKLHGLGEVKRFIAVSCRSPRRGSQYPSRIVGGLEVAGARSL